MEGLPGIHQRFIPKKHFVCSRESTKRFLHFFLEIVPKKRLFQTYTSTITAVKTWCDSETSWLIAQAWWKIWKRGENLVNFQNLLTAWRKPWWISNTWWIPKTWWKPGEFIRFSPKQTKKRFTPPKLTKRSVCSFFWWNLCVLWWNSENPKPGENLMKSWWIFKTWWTSGAFPKPGKKDLVNFQKLGEHLVISKTWWKPGEYAKPGENLVNAKTWRKLVENLVNSPGFHQTNERSVLRTEGFWVKRWLHSTSELV